MGITCYPSVGGSGILASSLGLALARAGHEVHFISYGRPVRLPESAPRVFFHPVEINDYALFKYPDYTLPLSVKMAEVSARHQLDILHVHYAVPHATAAILARDMLPRDQRPRIITTLHGTDTTLLGNDPGYGPAIRHALESSDAVTTVSHFLREETIRLLRPRQSIEVIHNFFDPQKPARSRAAVRRELGLGSEAMIVHSSNLRALKRIDLLIEAASRIRPADAFKLVILAGAPFAPFEPLLDQHGLRDRVIVLEQVDRMEDYLAAADLGLFTSETESFCLSILENMFFACPSVATAVGGIPEVIEDGVSGVLVPFGDAKGLAAAVSRLLADPGSRRKLGAAARRRARRRFTSSQIVPQYVDLYRRILA